MNIDPDGELQTSSSSRLKFIIGGLLIIAAVIYFIVSSTISNMQYFVTVDELTAERETIQGRNIRLSGAVVGDSIAYDPQTMSLSFSIAHVPGDNRDIQTAGGLASVLHQAVIDSANNRVKVVYIGVKPDLLRNESQAIVTGKLGEDGVFYAEELMPYKVRRSHPRPG
jgi:cytochrome c-type biogenesis protein CcmE